MKIIIAGGRDFNDIHKVMESVDHHLSKCKHLDIEIVVVPQMVLINWEKNTQNYEIIKSHSLNPIGTNMEREQDINVTLKWQIMQML